MNRPTPLRNLRTVTLLSNVHSDAVLERLQGLHPKLIDLSLDRVVALLGRLGNPHLSLPPVVHVAGTNGKGSVIAFMRAMLEATGYRVHVFTSPHLVRFNERIRLAGELISEKALSGVLEECEAVNDGDPVTFFEITTAAAYLAFSRAPADVLLLETGLGGRLDATNVIEKPALTVLTPVSLDHQQFLGDSIGEIMAEKTGILKKGVPCVTASQGRLASKVLTARARDAGAPLIGEGKDWFIRKGREGVVFEAGDQHHTLPLPRLAGAHQVRNAGLAVAALNQLPGFTVPEAALALGLKSAVWPARLQHLTEGALAGLLPGGWELWLDGGHNPASAKVLATHARQWRDKPLHLVMGMLNSKDPVAYLQAWEGRIVSLRGVAIPAEENSLTAADIVAAGGTWRIPSEPASSVTDALKDITDAYSDPARVLVCGSLYLAGTVLAENNID